ncbi:MAG: hypothetical protein RL417_919 [Pseudomonadota bacterium]|jgi:hypothetical protein
MLLLAEIAPRRVSRSSERGALLPLVGIISFAVIFILLGLGFDSSRVKAVREQLQREAEVICRLGARELPITKAAVTTALRGFEQSLVPSRLDTLRYARITEINVVSQTAPSTLAPAGNPGYVPTWVPVSPCPAGVSCRFLGDVSGTTLYPNLMWGRNDFNEALGCEVKAIAETFISGSREVNIKTVWHSKARGVLDAANPVSAPRGVRGQTGRGLILGIAPQLTTSADPTVMRRFLFDTNGSRYRDLAPFNPLENFDRSQSPGSSGVHGFWGDKPATPGFLEGFPALHDEMRRERLVACMNPLVAVRNAFSVGIVGRFRAELRDLAEVVTLNPIAQDNAAIPDGSFLPPRPTEPTVMVQGGSDTFLKEVQLPLQRFHPDEALNPGRVLDSRNKLDAAMLAQLRDCFHLYSGFRTSFSPEGIDRVLDPSLDNSGFEAPAILNVSASTAVAPRYIPLANDRWDQRTTGVGAASDRIAAEQAVATLGTTQLCPHGVVPAGSPVPPCKSGGKPNLVTDPALPTNDLRGDIRGFLSYLLNDWNGAPFPAHTALALPGTPPSAPVFSESSAVLLMMHNRLGQREADEIEGLVGTFKARYPGRKIVVVYFPSNEVDASTVAVARIRRAFQIVSGAPRGDDNLLFMFAPTTPGPGGSWDRAFQDYWHDLLLPGPSSIYARTYEIYRQLFSEEPKL